jgi:multidrug efflux pump subunit AcrB
MIAFVPLAYTGGIMGKFLRVIPIVVISVLSISLTEALLILPAHLSFKGSGRKGRFIRFTERINGWTDSGLKRFVNGPFAGFVMRAVRWRYVTLAFAFAIFLFTIGFIAGGYIKFTFFDSVEADNMIATLTMPQGTPVGQTRRIIERIEAAALQVIDEFDDKSQGKPPLMKHISTAVGAHPAAARGGPGHSDLATITASHLAEVNVELLSSEQRDASSTEMKNRWRDIVGEIPGVSSLKFMSEIMSTGDPINVELSHQNYTVLLQSVDQLKLLLDEYDGVSDISDSFETGKAELKMKLKDTGRTLGLDETPGIRTDFGFDPFRSRQAGQAGFLRGRGTAYPAGT